MRRLNWLGTAGLLSVFALLGYLSVFQSQQNTEAKREVAQATDSYCIALRGNGESQPAHWGALARTIEQLGLPSAMAGGSSATISMFLTEAIAANPQIRSQPLEMQKQRASLLWKSFFALVGEIQQTKTWSDIQALYGKAMALKNQGTLSTAAANLDAAQFSAAFSVVNEAVDLGLLDINTARPLLSALQASDEKRARFYIQQLQETLAVFGKFNAESDDNLFFRAGLVSFEKAAGSFGKIAGFYAAAESFDNPAAWEEFFGACAPGSVGLNWNEITEKRPVCKELFHNLFHSHFVEHEPVVHPEENVIGKYIDVYPTTSVLTGDAANQFRKAREQYHQALDTHFGKNFRIANTSGVKFGYWGSVRGLQRIASKLDPSDEKSKRFLALGPAHWKTVLSLSPAEPGLSPLKDFTIAGGQEVISAGGWSDLHPVAVLKASGCSDVVYLTRQGGESLFAQGVAKRLLNLKRDWKYLKADDEAAKKLNRDGDPSDLKSDWSLLYNLANPVSSVNRSMGQASAILCTNWNDFDVKESFEPLIEDSYRSSYWLNPKLNSALGLTPKINGIKPGCGVN